MRHWIPPLLAGFLVVGGCSSETVRTATPSAASAGAAPTTPSTLVSSPTTRPRTKSGGSTKRTTTTVASGPKVVSVTTSGEESCASAGGTNPVQPMLTLHWKATGADSVYDAVDNPNGPFETGLPVSGSAQLPFQCSGTHQYYVVAVKGTEKDVATLVYVDGKRR